MSKVNKKMSKADDIAAEVERKGSFDFVRDANMNVRTLLMESICKTNFTLLHRNMGGCND